ncbi:peptidoglycan DD-metalloendopeptidase family protein [Novilysobacter arseniciresistens]|uniref:peptidoglycan DD-metalloendopeptidase family protein n=1 Tax=Novilysobacter arseniciresistens TaxID=1385522 RepID=UPI001EF1444B|nr:M23 family metallopeptidase [Lysobacter arseniciresistens]
MRGPVAVLALAVAAMAPVCADAGQVYRWTDADGITHYGDRRPASEAPVTTLAVPSEPTPIAGLRIEPVDGGWQAWADNRLAGPIEVMLHYSRRENVDSRPALPARATVAAGGSALVAVLQSSDPARATAFELRMDSLPGHPSAAPRDVVYRLPLQAPSTRIDQGHGGSFSHGDAENRYAVDFATPEGTPVLAARDGVVMQTEGGFGRTGLDRDRYAGRANFVRILHDDGSMALYAHLQPGGVMVRSGQRVRAGQQVGLSGNTGFSTGPHLHFVVQVNRGMRLLSLPFRMAGPEGLLDLGAAGDSAATGYAASARFSPSRRHLGSLSIWPTERR